MPRKKDVGQKERKHEGGHFARIDYIITHLRSRTICYLVSDNSGRGSVLEKFAQDIIRLSEGGEEVRMLIQVSNTRRTRSTTTMMRTYQLLWKNKCDVSENLYLIGKILGYTIPLKTLASKTKSN